MRQTILSCLLAGMLGAAAIVTDAAAAGVKQTNLTGDGAVPAPFTDANLKNPWGMSYAPTGPWWISDNGTGLTTVYDGNGKPFPAASPLVVTIPPPAGAAGPSAPTGQVFNPTTSFVVGKGGKQAPAAFLFATENGTLSGWAPSVDVAHAVTMVDHSAGGRHAVYKGLAMAVVAGKPFLLAPNFRSGLVEVYDGSFTLTASFRDPALPGGYSPFNVAVLGGNIYVAYAVVAPGRMDELDGPGKGVVEQVDVAGHMLRRLARTHLNAPWGMALAPAKWGRFAGALLVGNFGDGVINAYNPATGAYIGPLSDTSGQTIRIPGLWGLMVGNDKSAGPSSSVFFTAGPNDEANGLFGALTYTP